MDDWQLLRDYAEHGSEAAFRTLVERHLDLVHAAARRQAVDPHLAEEISQAVFLLLARKAPNLPPNTLIAGWLYRTTRFVALRATRAEQRRRHREQQAVTMQDPITPQNAWDQLAPLIDEGMAALSEGDRNALLLRHLENRTFHEVGNALGISEEAAKKRTSRALTKLRAFLTRHGLAVPAGVLAVALSENGTQAAPGTLAADIAAKLSAAATAGAGAPQPPLVQEALDAWRSAHLRLTAGLTTGSLAVVTALTLFIRSWVPSPTLLIPTELSTRQTAASAQSESATSAAFPGADRAAVPSAAGQALYLYLVDDTTGRGIPSARICLNTVEGGKWRQRDDLATDGQGVVAISYPPDTARLDMGVVSDGWTARYATFRPHNDDPIPAEYTLRVSPVAQPIGGRLLSPSGQPVADAEVLASFQNSGDATARETPRERVGSPIWNVVVARSDSEGRWTCAVIPKNHPGFELEARHPDFARTTIVQVSPGGASRTASSGGTPSAKDPVDLLWDGALQTVLRPFAVLSGRVLDTAGAPIRDALIAHSPASVEPITARTDAEGWFRLPALEPERFDFAVSAPGFSPSYQELDLAVEPTPITVRLEPAAVLRLRITDEQGAGIPDIEVGLEQWGQHRHKLQWSARSDAEGRIVWDSAPVGERLELYTRGEGWCYTRDVWITPDDGEHPIVVRRAAQLTGVVTDASSGHLLADFKAYPGYGDGQYAWERSSTRHGSNGFVEVEFMENRLPWRLRVEAEGYQTFTSEPLSPTPTSTGISLEIALRPLDPEASIRGVVLGLDHRPLAGIEVGVLTLEHDVQLAGQALITRGGDQDPWIARTDAEGRFTFPPNPIAHSVVAASPRGFARVVMLTRRDPLTLRLQPWGALQGIVAPEVRAETVESLWLMHAQYGGRLQLTGDQSSVPLKKDATFAFGPLPPGCYVLWVNPGPEKSFRYRTPVQVHAGETTTATIGLRGPRVRGRLVLSASVSRPAGGWFPINLSSITPPPPPPRTEDFDRSMDAVEYWESPAGHAWALEGVRIAIHPDADGAFLTDEGLRPGDYLLTAYTRTGKLTQRVTVPESGAGLAEIDLGTIVLGSTDAASTVP